MSDSIRKGELDFTAARDQIEQGVESVLKNGSATIEIPLFVMEKGEIRFSFSPPAISSDRILEGMNLIHRHVEQVRVHSFEPGYLVLLSIEDGASPLASASRGTRFKFISMTTTARVEVTRKGNFSQEEVLACIDLFRLFHPDTGAADPTSILTSLGVSVYQSDESTGQNEDHLWNEIAGYDKTKREVKECIILPMKHPEMFREVARLARGRDGNTPGAVLFEGPPGVGKTTMARIIARIAGVPLIYVPVENILSKFYGESAQNMSRIFDAAALYDRAVLFLDEIDSLATSRDGGLFEATRRVLSVLLRKIDGFEKRDSIITIGATNRAGDLDRALLSRFDHIVSFPLPELAERAAIFSLYARHLDKNDLVGLADISAGLSGRHIQDICEYAERRHARNLIEQNLPPSPPSAELYLEVTRNRLEGEVRRGHIESRYRE